MPSPHESDNCRTVNCAFSCYKHWMPSWCIHPTRMDCHATFCLLVIVDTVSADRTPYYLRTQSMDRQNHESHHLIGQCPYVRWMEKSMSAMVSVSRRYNTDICRLECRWLHQCHQSTLSAMCLTCCKHMNECSVRSTEAGVSFGCRLMVLQKLWLLPERNEKNVRVCKWEIDEYNSKYYVYLFFILPRVSSYHCPSMREELSFRMRVQNKIIQCI